MVYVLLADGFEEIEALTPIDLLRRAGIAVSTVAVGAQLVTGAHGIPVQADILLDQVDMEEMEMIVIPGGLGGVDNIMASSDAMAMIERAAKLGCWVAAICAAPTILAYLGLLDRRNAVCYPTVEGRMGSAVVKSGQRLVVDGRFITCQAAGSSVRFGARLIAVLKGTDVAETVLNGIYC